MAHQVGVDRGARSGAMGRRAGGLAAVAALPETVPVLVAIALLVVAGLAVRRIVTMPGPGQGFVDTYIYLNAAATLVHHPAALYQPALHGMAGSAYVASESPDYLYPPSGVLPFLPLVPVTAALGKAPAASLWLLIDLACALLAVAMMSRHVGLPRPVAALCMLLTAVSAPMLSEISADNVNGVLLLLLAAAWIDLDAGRDRAGLWLGLAVALKPVIPLILLVPLIRGRWRAFLIACGLGLLLNLALLPLIGWSTAWDYLSRVLPWSAGWVAPRPANLALANLLRVFVGGGAFSSSGAALSPLRLAGPGVALGVAARLAVLPVALVAAWRVATPGLALALVAAPVALLSGTVWPHYLLLLVPLFLWAMATAPARSRPWIWVGTALLAVDLHPSGLYTPDVTVSGSLFHWVWLVHALLFDVAAITGAATLLVLAALGRLDRSVPGSGGERMGLSGRSARPPVTAAAA